MWIILYVFLHVALKCWKNDKPYLHPIRMHIILPASTFLGLCAVFPLSHADQAPLTLFLLSEPVTSPETCPAISTLPQGDV